MCAITARHCVLAYQQIIHVAQSELLRGVTILQYTEKFILTKLEKTETLLDIMACHLRQADRVISDIYAIHVERIEGEHRYCNACDIGSVWGVTYPCATVRALDPEWNEYE